MGDSSCAKISLRMTDEMRSYAQIISLDFGGWKWEGNFIDSKFMSTHFIKLLKPIAFYPQQPFRNRIRLMTLFNWWVLWYSGKTNSYQWTTDFNVFNYSFGHFGLFKSSLSLFNIHIKIIIMIKQTKHKKEKHTEFILWHVLDQFLSEYLENRIPRSEAN